MTSRVEDLVMDCAPATPTVAVAGGVTLSRRELLRGAAGGVTALMLTSLVPTAAQASEATGTESAAADPNGILIDLTRCSGCQQCALACQASNGCQANGAAPTGLSADSYSYVQSIALEEAATGPVGAETVTVKRQCMHCLHPACVSACTVGALHKRADGPVVYDASKCIGCRYCQYACPFGVPAFDWDNPLGLIHKCQMCASRLDSGLLPACVGACPNGALRAGSRTALLAQAHGQIASNPGRYVDHVYGEHEAGGTSVLYLSDVPFARLGFPVLDTRPIPAEAEAMMRRTPMVALGMATLATTLYYITRLRRRELAVADVVNMPAAGRAPADEGDQS